METKKNSYKTFFWLSILAGILVVGAVVITLRVYQRADASSAQTSEPAAATPSPQPGSDRKIVVYYFHGTYRCQSCTTIELYTGEAIKEAFADELKSGALEWQPLNVETPDTKHFIQDYKLYTKSVIVSDVRADKEHRWKNLEKVWELLRNEKAFKDYVKQEIAAYLKEQPS